MDVTFLVNGVGLGYSNDSGLPNIAMQSLCRQSAEAGMPFFGSAKYCNTRFVLERPQIKPFKRAFKQAESWHQC